MSQDVTACRAGFVVTVCRAGFVVSRVNSVSDMDPTYKLETKHTAPLGMHATSNLAVLLCL